jgi:hypothetical protein
MTENTLGLGAKVKILTGRCAGTEAKIVGWKEIAGEIRWTLRNAEGKTARAWSDQIELVLEEGK